jgi:hypothetical protein
MSNVERKKQLKYQDNAVCGRQTVCKTTLLTSTHKPAKLLLCYRYSFEVILRFYLRDRMQIRNEKKRFILGSFDNCIAGIIAPSRFPKCGVPVL